MPKIARTKARNPYRVRRSPIHGRGLFARAVIPAGQRIGLYEGPVTARDGDYVLWLDDDDLGEVGIDGQNELRYVNHSRRPNAVFEGQELFALETIPPGAEITHDYGEDWSDLG